MIYMHIYRAMIVVGQLGRIWAKGYQARRVYQTVTAVGFYALMTKTYNNKEQWAEEQLFVVGDQSSIINPKEVENDQVNLKFKNFKTWK